MEDNNKFTLVDLTLICLIAYLSWVVVSTIINHKFNYGIGQDKVIIDLISGQESIIQQHEDELAKYKALIRKYKIEIGVLKKRLNK